ncbi:MAG: extensin family protein [Myxococcales bacterium]
MATYRRSPCYKISDKCGAATVIRAITTYGMAIAIGLGCSSLDAGPQGQTPISRGAVQQVDHSVLPTRSTAPATGSATPAMAAGQAWGAATSGADVALVTTTEATASGLGGVGFERAYQNYANEYSTSPNAMATKYANLQPWACRAELRRRRLPVSADRGLAVGIAAPVRITGPLHGVRMIGPGTKSIHGKLDCRLVLLLDDLAELLAELGVAAIHVDGFYRPKAHLPGKRRSPSQHSFGLAVDIHALGLSDGRTLVIERDFGGKIGDPVCGASARVEPESRDAIELRNIVCKVAAKRAFHYLLTPNHDLAHRNHLHGDIKRGARQHLVR